GTGALAANFFKSGTDFNSALQYGTFSTTGTFVVFFYDNSGPDAGLYIRAGSAGTSATSNTLSAVLTVALIGNSVVANDIILI
ncbi:MAG: hypothetical protein ACI87W_002474, partial [Halieaceae bacterium]